MKFARYLQDTQTPEWKKAYIDYRGLKKLITAIKNAKLEDELEPLQESSHATPRASFSPVDGNTQSRGRADDHITDSGITGLTSQSSPITPIVSRSSVEHFRSSSELENQRAASPSIASTRVASTDSTILRPKPGRALTEYIPPKVNYARSSIAEIPLEEAESSGRNANHTTSGGFLQNLRRRHTMFTSQRSSNSNVQLSLPLNVVLASLSPLERKFIDKLDKELEKVEDFYRARERDALIRASALKEQLRELEDHRRLFKEAKADAPWTTVIDRLAEIPIPRPDRGKGKFLSPKSSRKYTRSPSPSARANGKRKLDPEEYKSSKKNLKKAVLEYYRGLELLNNYRVLNMTGFRKVLKKFEKAVHARSIQQAYMSEKVEVSAFASGEAVEKLVKETEDNFAAQFEKGDIKKARGRLRSTAKHKSHHFSTFRSGMYLGLAVPALVDGLVRSFHQDVRDSIPADALLYVYATFFVPLVFSILVGTNIWVWTRNRINYQFIFELDVRTQLDSREYFELPSLLLSTLIYAFWLSFSQLGAGNVAPTVWPIAWLCFALLVIFFPIPVLFPSSRWWLIRKCGKLLASGTKSVEFTDFWLGDQFCSLTFTLSNLYFVGCVYRENWDDVWEKCSSSQHWGIPFLLASLPLFVRAVQSVKRYVDSRLYTHLVNGGKYCSSILYYFFYYTWRHHGRASDYTLVLFCLFATIASIYTCTWDLLMDWSFFKHPAKRPFLRQELIYSTSVVYYIAIISNIIGRFQWILYLPFVDVNFQVRQFIVGMLEMVRRWQWNFYRLENEHIGNTDQYRVTREVPLPYHIDEAGDGSDEDDEHENFTSKSWHRRPVRMTNLSSDEEGRHGADSEA